MAGPSVYCTSCARWWRPEYIWRRYKGLKDGGPTGQCKRCKAAYQRQWRASNPERSRAIEKRAYDKARSDPQKVVEMRKQNAARQRVYRAKHGRAYLAKQNRLYYARRRDLRPERHQEYLQRQYEYQKQRAADPARRPAYLDMRNRAVKRYRLRQALRRKNGGHDG